MATPEQQEDLEVCASVYPELRHDWSAAAGLVFILPLARPGASCHFLVTATHSGKLELALNNVKGWIDADALLCALKERTQGLTTVLEILCCATELVSALNAPCPICLEEVSGHTLPVSCVHVFHQGCGGRYIYERVEGYRASPEYKGKVAARQAVAAEANGRVKVAQQTVEHAQASLSACEARVAELQGALEAQKQQEGAAPPKRALPPSRARRFEEKAEEEGPPLSVQLLRAQGECQAQRGDLAAAQAKLGAVRESVGATGSGGGSCSGGGSGGGGDDAEALKEHLAVFEELPSLGCPVCRVALPRQGFYPAEAAQLHAAALEAAASASLKGEKSPLPAHLAQLVVSFQALWKHQVERGGIIEGSLLGASKN
jgi:hypothetical protein